MHSHCLSLGFFCTLSNKDTALVLHMVNQMYCTHCVGGKELYELHNLFTLPIRKVKNVTCAYTHITQFFYIMVVSETTDLIISLYL